MVFTSLPVYAQFNCQNIFRESHVAPLTTENMDLILTELGKIEPEVLSLSKIPTWQDFEVITSLIKALEAPAVSTGSAVPGNANKLKRALDDHFSTVEVKDHTFTPTELHMQLALRKALERVNELLPHEARFKIPRLPISHRERRTQQQTEVLMKQILDQFKKLFKTTGYKDLLEYKTAIIGKGNVDLLESFELLEKGDFDLSIRRPERGRFWLPKVGFHNQFVTGSSEGYFKPIGRNHAESSWTGSAVKEYALLNPEVKPKYGSVRPKPNSKNMTPANSEESYGPDIFILKKNAVKDRLTFNIGDSNGLLSQNHPEASWVSTVFEPKAWDQSFIPWEYRTLLAPFLSKQAFGRPVRDQHKVLQKTFNMDDTYFEIQVFGELSLSDVKAFEFTYNPPSGDFLRELQLHNIEIRDGRTWPAKIWEPAPNSSENF